jgi:hypothetical protein
MRHLFPDHGPRPTDAAGTRLAGPRAAAAPGASSDSACRRRPGTRAEPDPSTLACSSADPGRKTNRSEPAAGTTGSGSFETPRPSSSREDPHWTRLPLPGETSLCGTKPQLEKAQGKTGKSRVPWAFGLPGALVLPHVCYTIRSRPPIAWATVAAVSDAPRRPRTSSLRRSAESGFGKSGLGQVWPAGRGITYGKHNRVISRER